MIIRERTGLSVEAVLLAANSQTLRVAIASRRDTAELHKMDGCWCTETGAPIEIEALFATPGMDVSTFCAAVQPRAMAAGVAFPVS